MTARSGAADSPETPAGRLAPAWRPPAPGDGPAPDKATGAGRWRSGQPGSRRPARLPYEKARDELTELVKRLEAGGLTLEQSLELWERGERLADICEDWLDGARARLAAAMARAGGRPRGPGGTVLGARQAVPVSGAVQARPFPAARHVPATESRCGTAR